MPYSLRLGTPTGALKTGLAGKGVIKPLGWMGVFRREAFEGQIGIKERLVGATAPAA
ncbi:hypothetical protein AE1304_04630 [Aeromonas enteropelogenes]